MAFINELSTEVSGSEEEGDGKKGAGGAGQPA